MRVGERRAGGFPSQPVRSLVKDCTLHARTRRALPFNHKNPPGVNESFAVADRTVKNAEGTATAYRKYELPTPG